VLPSIDAVGVYELSAPFTVAPGEVLKCSAIETFESLQLSGVDVYNAHYKPLGLPATVYAADLATGGKIVTLISTTSGNAINLPESYIVAAPPAQTSDYTNVILSADLGLIPDKLDITAITDGFKDYCSDIIGVMPQVQIHRYPITVPVTPAQAALLERNRLAAITDRRTAYAELKHWIGRTADTQAQVDVLEALLLNLK